MTVAVRKGTIHLEGRCPSGDAEELLQVLLSDETAGVDWRACQAAHTAVVQVLLAAGRPILGPPRDAFLVSVVAGALIRGQE